MTSPWDDKQKPNEKSKDDGKKDDGHGPNEHGLGGRKADKDKEPKAPKLHELLASSTPELVVASELPDDHLAAAATFPSYYYLPNTPPVRDQGTTPQCVAYSDAYDQAHMDRPEAGRFLDFDEAKFFGQIGGSYLGAYLGDALERRRDEGYPVAGVGNRSAHRIAGFYRVDPLVNAIKAAIKALPTNGGVLVIGPWYHSWFHPFASGKLPAPDYEIGGHATWWRGWNDNYGFRIRNSWGTGWGVGGDCYLPYSYLARMWEIYRTKDR